MAARPPPEPPRAAAAINDLEACLHVLVDVCGRLTGAGDAGVMVQTHSGRLAEQLVATVADPTTPLHRDIASRLDRRTPARRHDG